MLAIGAGGLDVAMAMAGREYFMTMPQIVKVELKGKLNPGVSAKDIILEVLRICKVKGGGLTKYLNTVVMELSIYLYQNEQP